MSASPQPPNERLTPRKTLILLLALITTIVAGFLCYLGTRSVALVIYTGGATFAASWRFYNDIVS